MDSNDEIECNICGFELKEKFCHRLECGHIFHYECLMKTFQSSTNKINKCNFCPYCRKKCKYLPIVNGLKKPLPNVHFSYTDKISFDVNNNIPCNYVFKRGNREGEICGKNCKLGYHVCNSHFKFDNK